MLTIDDFFSIASPTTLASLIADVKAAGTGATSEQMGLEQVAWNELVANVGLWDAAILVEHAGDPAKHIAEWTGDRYEVRSLEWTSRDGDEWKIASTGLPCGGPLFDRSAIVLRGGPRNGVTVL